MLRLRGNVGWLLLAVLLLCVPFQNASAQETGTTAQPRNRTPIPQAAQSPTVGPNSAPAPVVTPSQVKEGTGHKKKTATKAKAPEPEVAQAPVVPPTLEQMPPSVPSVSYQNGQLSINAHNSTLSQVLRSVQQQTGASIDVPGGASGERVVANLGPGRPRDVLASLLNGSHFNYVILGTPGNAGGVQKVILTNRQSSAAAPTVQANNIPQQQAPPPPVDDENPPEEDQAATYPDSDVSQGTQLVPSQLQRPGNGVEPQGDQGTESQDPSQPQNQVKTPEQLLQELQRMQQQQQQYQQQLNPANQQPMNPPDQPQ
jgi:hypothetical protein